MEDVKYGSLGLNQLLQVFWMEVVSIHVDSREEDGLHLVMPQLISWLMGCYQDLMTKQNMYLEEKVNMPTFCSQRTGQQAYFKRVGSLLLERKHYLEVSCPILQLKKIMNSVINCYYFYINKLQDFLNVISSKFKMKICLGKYDSQLV